MAKLDNQEIKIVIRWGRNGKKYVWNNPTQSKLDSLVARYGVDQLNEDVLWLER